MSIDARLPGQQLTSTAINKCLSLLRSELNYTRRSRYPDTLLSPSLCLPYAYPFLSQPCKRKEANSGFRGGRGNLHRYTRELRYILGIKNNRDQKTRHVQAAVDDETLHPATVSLLLSPDVNFVKTFFFCIRTAKEPLQKNSQRNTLSSNVPVPKVTHLHRRPLCMRANYIRCCCRTGRPSSALSCGREAHRAPVGHPRREDAPSAPGPSREEARLACQAAAAAAAIADVPSQALCASYGVQSSRRGRRRAGPSADGAGGEVLDVLLDSR